MILIDLLIFIGSSICELLTLIQILAFESKILHVPSLQQSVISVIIGLKTCKNAIFGDFWLRDD